MSSVLFAALLGVAILFFPSQIGPEPLEARVQPDPISRNAPPKISKAKPFALAQMKLKNVAEFDRERFLKSFERQTSAALIKCLQAGIGEKGILELVARLQANGRLTAVRSTNASASQISCAVPMIEQMQFSLDLSPELTKRSGGVEIEWRLDW